MDMKKKKKVTLISSNGKIFEVDLAMVVSECGHIRELIERGIDEGLCRDEKVLIREKGDDDKIIFRLPKTTGKILALVLEYCSIKCTNNNHEEDLNLKIWEAKLAELDEVVLAHLLLTANYLFMWELVPLGGEVMSNKGKTLPEVIEIFTTKLDEEEK